MNPIEVKAREHLRNCLRCLGVVAIYNREIEQAIAGAPLPDALASKLRARLCKQGAALLDGILGVA